MKDWKTSLTGAGAVLAVVGKILNDLANGGAFNISAEDMGILAVGVGLWNASDTKPTQDGTKL